MRLHGAVKTDRMHVKLALYVSCTGKGPGKKFMQVIGTWSILLEQGKTTPC